MVETDVQWVGPRIGVERRESEFRAEFVSALRARPCVGWAPKQCPEASNGLDVVIVEGRDGAEDALARWPQVALVRWGRPEEASTDMMWDGWINRSLDAPDAADVLMELLDAGLLGRSHGPRPASKPNFST